MYIFVIYDTNMRSNSKVWILDYGVFALWGYNNSDVVHLRSGACGFVLLTLPTGGEAGGLTKEGRNFLK